MPSLSGPRHLVRCVRGESYGVNDFVDNGDGTITDQATGLMWAQADSGSGMDWEHALAYAQTQNAANYLGHSDWRLPNTKELQSLVDYTRSPGATDPANVGPAIDPLFSCTAITNEAGDADYPWYWTSTSANAQANERTTPRGTSPSGGLSAPMEKTFTERGPCASTRRFKGHLGVKIAVLQLRPPRAERKIGNT